MSILTSIVGFVNCESFNSFKLTELMKQGDGSCVSKPKEPFPCHTEKKTLDPQ